MVSVEGNEEERGAKRVAQTLNANMDVIFGLCITNVVGERVCRGLVVSWLHGKVGLVAP